MKEILGWVAQQIGQVLGGSAKKLFADRRLAFSTAIIFTVAAVILGIWTLERADYYQRIVETSLTKNTENTPQTFKALESLILVAAESGPDGNQLPLTRQIESAQISHDFGTLIAGFDAKLREQTVAADSKTLKISESEIATGGSVLATGGNVPPASGRAARAQETIITEENDLGFLFLPARLLHLKDASLYPGGGKQADLAQLVGITTDKQRDTCVAGTTKDICDDVLVTRNILATMKEATTLPVAAKDVSGVDPKPAQVYVITGNGINRIVSTNGQDSSFYRNQFQAKTVFPARPYYIGAFTKIGEPRELLGTQGGPPPQGPVGGDGGYFYVSEPYLDIGGNGIVITLARAFRYPNNVEGVLCFDLKLSIQDLGKKLAPFVTDLDGKSASVTCQINGNSYRKCNYADGNRELADEIDPSLEDTLQGAQSKGGIADVIGNFSFLGPANESQTATVNAGIIQVLTRLLIHPKNEIRFIISTDPPRIADPAKQDLQLKFFAASLNIGRYLQSTAIVGAIALSCLCVAITILTGSWASEAQITDAVKIQREAEQREQEELRQALDNVSKVMLKATVPYVRLDKQDNIIDANLPFVELLGYPPDSDVVQTKLRHTRFEDWIATPASITEYHRIQKLREMGAQVDPYQIAFRTTSGSSVIRTVVSSVVPGAKKGSLPETFGILV